MQCVFCKGGFEGTFEEAIDVAGGWAHPRCFWFREAPSEEAHRIVENLRVRLLDPKRSASVTATTALVDMLELLIVQLEKRVKV